MIKCKDCKKEFRDSYHLERHTIAIHNKLVSYTCPKCGKPLDLETALAREEKEKEEKQLQKDEIGRLEEEIQKIRKEAPSEDKFREIAKELLDGLKEEEKQVFKYTTDEITRLEKENAKLKKKVKRSEK